MKSEMINLITNRKSIYRLINNQIDIYKLEISLLENTKPCFFQRKTEKT